MLHAIISFIFPLTACIGGDYLTAQSYLLTMGAVDMIRGMVEAGGAGVALAKWIRERHCSRCALADIVHILYVHTRTLILPSCSASSLKRDVRDWQWLMGIGTAANYRNNLYTSQRWNSLSLCRSRAHYSLDWMSCNSATFTSDYSNMPPVISDIQRLWFQVRGWYTHVNVIAARTQVFSNLVKKKKTIQLSWNC